MAQKCDVLIIGAGVVGLSTGIALLKERAALKIVITEKEKSLAIHASGRNSGVLHAGFYYSPDSLKAKFCREGNFQIRSLAKKYNIPIRDVGKIVVTRSESELILIDKLFQRGEANGVELEMRDEKDLRKFEPLANTFQKFLWSPNTAVSNPKSIVLALAQEFISLGGKIHFESKTNLSFFKGEIFDSNKKYEASYIVNAAGAHEKNLPLQRLVYPGPHPVNPVLGVHFTLTSDYKVKIGPTAIPIFGREQYSLMTGWSVSDIMQASKGALSLIHGAKYDLAEIIRTELPNFSTSRMLKRASQMIPAAHYVRNWRRKPPGIRAQLVHLPTGTLEQDFVLKSKFNSIHILNVVSPGWTSALPFGSYISQQIIRKL